MRSFSTCQGSKRGKTPSSPTLTAQQRNSSAQPVPSDQTAHHENMHQKKYIFLHLAAANKQKDTAITQQVLVDLHAVTQKCPAKGERAKCSESIFSSLRAECWRDGPVVDEKNHERNINPEEFGFSFGNWFPNCWSSNPSQMWNVLLKNNTQ